MAAICWHHREDDTASGHWSRDECDFWIFACSAWPALYNCKRNEFWLVLMEIFGGLAPEGGKLFRLYTQRAKAGVDRTEYVTTDSATQGAHKFAPHWAQLLSASVVEGDAARSLRAVDKARTEAMHRATVSPRRRPASRAALDPPSGAAA